MFEPIQAALFRLWDRHCREALFNLPLGPNRTSSRDSNLQRTLPLAVQTLTEGKPT